MDELIKVFHINWQLLIAQAVNFIIVMLVLMVYAVKPLMKLMEERSKKIDDGLKNAVIIEEQLKKTEVEKAKEIKKGRREAQVIIGQAEKDSEEIRRGKVEKTKKEAEKIVGDAKNEIVSERRKMISEVKSELVDLVMLASDKISNQTINAKQHEKLINDVLDELKTADIK